MYATRFYRNWVSPDDLNRFAVAIEQSDLLILCDRTLRDRAHAHLSHVRREIEEYIASDPVFLTTLVPHEVPSDAPSIVQHMAQVARAWGVGPMAAVAGAVAEAVGRHLLDRAKTVIVENGGDVYARADRRVQFALYAGEDSPFSDKLAFEVDAARGVGVCTSSGKVGPSLSFGQADAVVAIARDAAFADAAATAIGNRIHSAADVERVVAEERERGALVGLVVCAGDRMGLFGDVQLDRQPFELRRHERQPVELRRLP